ncbi:MAG: UDP-N-acetylmuramate dehydrogenase [Candidatus Omnitrophica bacterium]|nr:UDP-N-acetylmuramate dehydrogenase [Candidatus Omnitrophota bacterium]
MSLRIDSKTSIRTEVPLTSYSTFKIGGPARFFAEPRTREELFQVLEFQKAEGVSLLILGRGSNVLISDDGFSGLAVSLRQFEPDQFSVDPDGLLHVSGGMSLFRLAMISQEEGLRGVEFVCHIPGTVGGAIVMNAGFGRRGHGYFEIKDVFESCAILDLNSNQIKVLRKQDIRFEYRSSSLGSNHLVLEAAFRLTPTRREIVEAEIKANFAYRNSVQDLRFPSAGSTFKNPKDHPLTSGELLERAKMKGFRIGGAMVSERHANFFLNVDHARAQDVLELMAVARNRVFEEFGVQLEPEVRYVGS